jgi:hypothetical protein
LPSSPKTHHVAACAWGGSPLDPPGSSAAEISRIVIPFSPFINLPVLTAATPADSFDLPFTCTAEGYSVPIQVTAYPYGDPLSPDSQVFSGNSTVQATYSRRGSYDVYLSCHMGDPNMGGATSWLTVPDSAFPPALRIWANQTDRWLYCAPASQMNSMFTLGLAALTPNAPVPLSGIWYPDKKEAILTVQPDYFPFGDYLLTATCVSNVSSGEKYPWTATPLTLSSSHIATRKVIPEITGCSKQGDNS